MTSLIMIFLVFCAAVLQALIPGPAWLGDVPPPILLSVTLYFSLTGTRGRAVTSAIACGFVQDALTLIPLGYSAFGFCLVAAGVNRWRDEVFARAWITHVLFGFLSYIAVTALLFVLLYYNGLLRLDWSTLLFKLGGASVLGAVVTPIVFRGVEWLEGVLGDRGERRL